MEAWMVQAVQALQKCCEMDARIAIIMMIVIFFVGFGLGVLVGLSQEDAPDDWEL